ncbi:MAG: tetraacyldisaccharide 4'-kinase [Kiritimatiellia bacterium]
MKLFGEKSENFLVDLITGRIPLRLLLRRDIFLLRILRGLALVYGAGVQFRLFLYHHGIFRHHTLGCQIISVGNLTVGGTGKTPVVEVFARTLQRQGRHVAVLSRGYRRKAPPVSWCQRLSLLRNPHAPPSCVVSDPQGVRAEPLESGDEPYMLARRLPGTAVLVDPDRVKSGRFAIRSLGCDTLILDDGFQHPELHHRLDIVLVDSRNPFGNGYVLPRGVLREPFANIRRASYIFLTKCEDGGPPKLVARIRALNPTAEIIACRHQARYLQDVQSPATRPLEYLRGLRVAALSGIAAPEGFEQELEKRGAILLRRERYADHHWYSREELETLIRAAALEGVQAIVTTEKDAVRFPRLETGGMEVLYLRVEIELSSGTGTLDECISRICSLR